MQKSLFFLFILIVNPKLYSQSVEVYTDTVQLGSSYLVTKYISVMKDDNYIDGYRFKTEYFPSGKIKSSWTEPSATSVEYYENGNFEVIRNDIKGRLIGLYLLFHPNGIIEIIGNYKDIECYSDITIKTEITKVIDDENGGEYEMNIKSPESVKTGKWLYFNEKGDIIKTENYP